MQHCSCFVFLGGELTSSVWKADVTVAEIALLRAIHGDDAITTIVPTYKAAVKSADELDRLRVIYGASNVSKEGKRLVDDIYPGRAPQLPTTLADIDVDAVEEVADEPVAKPAKAAKASPASTALLGGSDGE